MNVSSIDILLIEDNAGDARLIREMLKDGGINGDRLTIAGTLSLGTELIRTRKFHIVILDLNLPDSTGISTLDHVVENICGSAPVIVLTGLEDEALGLTAIERGAEDYLVKGDINAPQLSRSARYALERHRMGRELRANEEKYRIITDNMSDTVWLMDMDLRTTYISPSVEKTRGYTLEELQNMPLERHITPDSLKTAAAAISEELAPERLSRKDLPIIRTLTLEFYRRDGSTYWSEVTLSVLRGPDGSPTGLLGVGRDITERKRAEEAIISRNRELAVLHDTAFELASLRYRRDLYVFIVNRLGVITGASAVTFGLYDPLKRVIRVEHAEIDSILMDGLLHSLGGRLDETVFPISDEMMNDLIRNPIRVQNTLTEATFGLVPPEISQEVQHSQGIDRFVGIAYIVEGKLYGTSVLGLSSGTSDPSLDMLRSFAGLVAVSLRRTVAEEELRESEERYRMIFENSLDAFFLTIPDGTILSVNPAGCRMFGRDETEIKSLGRNGILDSSDPRTREGLMERESTGSFKGELTGIKSDGTRFPVEVSSMTFRDHDGKTRTSVTIHDITERKRAEKRIAEFSADLEKMVSDRTAALEKANRELESFSYTVSHDLRAPLRHIHGFLDLFLREIGEITNDKARGYIEVVNESTLRMGRLIDDLLSFSRMGRAGFTMTYVDMTLLVNEAVRLIGHEIGSRLSQLRIEELPGAYGDRSMLLLVFTNLLSNAFKFTSRSAHPSISVTGEIEGGEAVYCVKDNGAGFDMRYADKLFGVFQRLHRESDYPGTGIGLATVLRVIERHGGRVWAEGVVNKGASFCFALPLKTRVD